MNGSAQPPRTDGSGSYRRTPAARPPRPPWHSPWRVEASVVRGISTLRLVVLRIAVRQAHTSNASVPQCLTLS
jgi:hypothetical protein